jgi:hypothetical protein
MPSLLLLVALFTSALLLGAAGSAPGQEACPSSLLWFQGRTVATGSQAGRDTTLTDSLRLADPGSDSTLFRGDGAVRLALAQRHFEAEVHSENSLYVSGGGRDEYHIEGPPAGTPVTFQVRLVGTDTHVFDIHCGGSGCMPLTYATVHGSGPGEQLEHVRFSFPPSSTRSFDLSMSLVRAAGESFQLDYEIVAGTSHTPSGASIVFDVSFEGLPAGARVVSCLDAEQPTPGRVTTWGELKSRYR